MSEKPLTKRDFEHILMKVFAHWAALLSDSQSGQAVECWMCKWQGYMADLLRLGDTR